MTAPRESDNLCPSVLSDEIFVWPGRVRYLLEETEAPAEGPGG